jgi:hypothetical protein
MIWLTWRQFRTQALAALAVLAAAAVYLVVTGLHMHHTYAADQVLCRQPHAQCGLIIDQFTQAYDNTQQALQLLLLAIPVLVGIFWGAPLIAAELERGTHRMVWNQSVSPLRWLTVKLAVVGLSAVSTVGLLSLLLTWWSSPLDLVGDDRFEWHTFTTRNVVPLGYAAFAFTLGVVFGLLARRALPAMALTLAVFIGLQIVFATAIRPNLLPSTTVSQAVDASLAAEARGIGVGAASDGPVFLVEPGPPGAWIQSESNLLDSAGNEIVAGKVESCFDSPPPSLDAVGQCLVPYHLHMELTYQPADHYWPLQWYETGIYLALAALFGGACYWRIRRHRD